VKELLKVSWKTRQQIKRSLINLLTVILALIKFALATTLVLAIFYLWLVWRYVT